MKNNLLFLLLSLVFIGSVNAQERKNISAEKWNLGVNVAALDFYTPKLNEFSSFKKNMAIGPDVTFIRNFFKSGIGISANLLSPNIMDQSLEPLSNKYLLMFGPGLIYNFSNSYMIPAKFPIAPYLFVNALSSVATVPYKEDKTKMGFGIPVGLGINWKLAEGLALNTRGGYMFGLTDYFEDNVYWSAGFTFNISKAKVEELPAVLFVPVDTDGDGIPDEDDECPEVAGLPELKGCPDTDGDGITDHKDECPDVAGLAEFNGCPDRDGDGIPDHKDECPDVAGLAKFNGCPEPDTDGDGIVDSKDECPNVAGLASLNGCPDRDGDGVPDYKDKCPDVAGPISNKGCPEVEEKVKARLKEIAGTVKFETGKSVLAKDSYKLLDEVVKILNDHPAYNVNVEGYTDSTGSDAINDKLSNERAKVCADYIVSKAIAADRVSSIGFGSKNPIADNKTAAGRAKNRRTEFNLFIKD